MKNMKAKRGNGQGSIFKRGGRGSWYAVWYDHDGKRQWVNTKSTDQATARRFLAKKVDEVAQRDLGLVDANQDSFTQANARLLAEHVEDYLTHCRTTGQNTKAIEEKRRHLHRLMETQQLKRLSDLTADAMSAHMAKLKDAGKSARTANFARQATVAFMNWCKRYGRIRSNPLAVVPKLDEQQDRRRIRRALTDQELARLLAVAREHGREAFYLLAALAGLRRGDLRGIQWRDVDLEQNTLTIRATVGKSRRQDILSLHPQAAEALRSIRPTHVLPEALSMMPVFATEVTSQTVLKDLYRAGLARLVYQAEDGTELTLAQSRQRKAEGERIRKRYDTSDEQGRSVDLHALRTTLGTQLARAGVAPQVAQRIMRHSDYRTTQQHYTVLGLADTTAAINRLPGIGSQELGNQANRATGTDDSVSSVDADKRMEDCSNPCSNRGANSHHFHANRHDEGSRREASDDEDNPLDSARKREEMRAAARADKKAGDRIRTGDVQLD